MIPGPPAAEAVWNVSPVVRRAQPQYQERTFNVEEVDEDEPMEFYGMTLTSTTALEENTPRPRSEMRSIIIPQTDVKYE